MDPSWVILTICEPWEIGPNEAPPATITVHSPDRWEEDVETIMPVKFHGRPPPDARNRAGEAAAAATVGNRVFRDFSAISGHFRPPHSSFPPFLDPLNSFPWSLLQIPHRLEVTTKTKLSDDWIEFFGHHNDCWTKVMVLMSSLSLGLSIDMWFINFGRRLVSFPFLGCFG